MLHLLQGFVGSTAEIANGDHPSGWETVRILAAWVNTDDGCLTAFVVHLNDGTTSETTATELVFPTSDADKPD